MVIPPPQVVPGNVAMDVGTVEEAAVVLQTLAMVGMALTRQLKATVFQQNMWENMWEGAVSKVIEDPVWGEGVQLAAETHSLSSATGPRDGATWPESSLPQHLL